MARAGMRFLTPLNLREPRWGLKEAMRAQASRRPCWASSPQRQQQHHYPDTQRGRLPYPNVRSFRGTQHLLKHTILNHKPCGLITITDSPRLPPSTDVCFGTTIVLVIWRLCLNLAIIGKDPLCKLNFPVTFITVGTKRVFQSIWFCLWNMINQREKVRC